MRKTESLLVIKRMFNFKHLHKFSVKKSLYCDDTFFARCYSENGTEICASYDIVFNKYYLNINHEGNTSVDWALVFTECFAHQVFKAIELIYLEKRCKNE